MPLQRRTVHGGAKMSKEKMSLGEQKLYLDKKCVEMMNIPIESFGEDSEKILKMKSWEFKEYMLKIARPSYTLVRRQKQSEAAKLKIEIAELRKENDRLKKSKARKVSKKKN